MWWNATRHLVAHLQVKETRHDKDNDCLWAHSCFEFWVLLGERAG